MPLTACIARFEGEPGIDDPAALCRWMEQQGTGFFAAGSPDDPEAIARAVAAYQALTPDEKQRWQTARGTESAPAVVALVEFVTSAAALRVDREAGVISDTKILGWASSNRRRYKPEGVDPALYEGRKVYVDHATSKGGRSAREVFGWHEGVTKREDGLYGTFHVLNPKTDLAESVFRAAELRPGLFGFSHHVDARETRGPGGESVVESVLKVHSVDLVSEPATTQSLFESRESSMSATTTTPPPPVGDYWTGQVQAIMADAGLDAPSKTLRINELLRAQARLAERVIDPDEDPAVAALTEQVRRLEAQMASLQEERDCRDLVDAANLKFASPTARKAFVRALGTLSADERAALIAERRHGQRGGTAPRATLPAHGFATVAEERVPEDPKALARWLTD